VGFHRATFRIQVRRAGDIPLPSIRREYTFQSVDREPLAVGYIFRPSLSSVVLTAVF
jgi:hypothetical protein